MISRRVLTLSAAVLGSVLAFLLLVAVVLRIAHRGVLPGVVVAGVQAGGMDEAQLRAALGDVAAARAQDTVTLTHAGRTFDADGGDLGFEVDYPATVAAALAPGRSGGFLSSSWAHIASLWRRVELDLSVELDDAAVTTFVDEIAADVDQPPSPGDVVADPVTLELTLTAPAAGSGVDVEATRALVQRSADDPGDDRFDLPVTSVPPRVSEADVQSVLAQAQAALRQPLSLNTDEVTVTLQPVDIARVIALEEVETPAGWTVRIAADTDAVEPLFASVVEQLDTPAVDARFEVAERPTTLDEKGDVTWEPVRADVQVVPSVDGRAFDPDLTADQIGAMLAAGSRTADLQLADVEPELTTAEARALGVTHLIGTFTTYHDCCQSRVTNIHRIADIVDGHILEPGEQFSVNEVVGERTTAGGFVPAPGIFQGELRDEIGGGVSQFATTTFNAVFFAGLQLDAYNAHSLYISRYPLGREATLNYPSIDLAFTNDTAHGLFIDMSYSDTSVTTAIYGDNGGREVTAVMGEPYGSIPFAIRYKENPLLPPGTEVHTQAGANGFKVDVDRIIVFADGRRIERTLTTTYYPKPEIIERNTTATPPPSPSGPPPSSSEPPPSPPPPTEPEPEPTETNEPEPTDEPTG